MKATPQMARRRTARPRPPVLAGIVVATLAGATPVLAQAPEEETPFQLWANAILAYPQNEHLYYELDIEPKGQVQGEPMWVNADATPLLEYYPNNWLDLTAEATVGWTVQNDEIRTFELTPRIGVRFHLLSNLRDKVKKTRLGAAQSGSWLLKPLNRLGIANLTRLEYRSFRYAGDIGEPYWAHEWRLRNRTELKLGINKADYNAEGTLYMIADLEAFIPLGDAVAERYASRWRVRLGLGYALSYRYRIEALYIRNADRQTLEEEVYEISSNAVDARLKIFF